MAASADNPPSSSFQIRAIPKSLTDKLEDWGHNQDLATIIKRMGSKGHLKQLKAQVNSLTASSVDREDLQQSTHIAVLAAIPPLICLILIGAGSFTLWRYYGNRIQAAWSAWTRRRGRGRQTYNVSIARQQQPSTEVCNTS